MNLSSTDSNKRIGILGGTFNPFHNSHYEIAKGCIEKLNLTELLIIPNNAPPHKKSLELVDIDTRFEIIQKSTANLSKASISRLESSSNKNHFTYETLLKIKEDYNVSADNMYFIMGTDSLMNFENWKNPDIISKTATICFVSRPKTYLDSNVIENIKKKFNAKIVKLELNTSDISSSNIRHLIKYNNIIEGVSDSTKDIIIENELYSYLNTSRFEKEKILNILKQRLDEKRFKHSINVADTASKLAKFYGIDTKYAYYAGLLHDFSKCYENDKYIEIARSYNIDLSCDELQTPAILHGKIAAFEVSQEFSINDENFLNSLRYHTTGRPDMSLLEKIIYIADYIEPGRTIAKNLDKYRKMVYENIDLTVCYIVKDTISLLESKKAIIDNLSRDTYEYYKGIAYDKQR